MHLELDLRTPVCGFEFFWRKSYRTGQTSHYMQNHAKPYMQNHAKPCKTRPKCSGGNAAVFRPGGHSIENLIARVDRECVVRLS